MLWYLIILTLLSVPMIFAIIGYEKKLNTKKLVVFCSATIFYIYGAQESHCRC